MCLRTGRHTRWHGKRQNSRSCASSVSVGSCASTASKPPRARRAHANSVPTRVYVRAQHAATQLPRRAQARWRAAQSVGSAPVGRVQDQRVAQVVCPVRVGCRLHRAWTRRDWIGSIETTSPTGWSSSAKRASCRGGAFKYRRGVLRAARRGDRRGRGCSDATRARVAMPRTIRKAGLQREKLRLGQCAAGRIECLDVSTDHCPLDSQRGLLGSPDWWRTPEAVFVHLPELRGVLVPPGRKAHSRRDGCRRRGCSQACCSERFDRAPAVTGPSGPEAKPRFLS